jgi:integrase
MSEPHPNTPVPAGKPAKPYPDFPLFPHATKRWAKKIKGRLVYFGKVDDSPDRGAAAALARFEAWKASPGEDAAPAAGALTLKALANAFLQTKRDRVNSGELSPRSWEDYRGFLEVACKQLGGTRPVAEITPQDLARLRAGAAGRWGPARLAKFVQAVRMMFKFGYEEALMERPVRLGNFTLPTKKVLRMHRAKQGPKLFTADEIRRLVAAAPQPVKAQALLGINCGFGNSDCANLPLAAVDLERGWVDFPRPKTGMPRRCPLWPETVAALREAMAGRPAPRGPGAEGLFFLTSRGRAWKSDDSSYAPVSQQFAKVLKALGINGRKGLGFYVLRHTARTVWDGAKDQPAADLMMGHEVPHMSSVYREGIDDARLRAVSDHVRAWLFGPAGNA